MWSALVDSDLRLFWKGNDAGALSIHGFALYFPPRPISEVHMANTLTKHRRKADFLIAGY